MSECDSLRRICRICFRKSKQNILRNIGGLCPQTTQPNMDWSIDIRAGKQNKGNSGENIQPAPQILLFDGVVECLYSINPLKGKCNKVRLPCTRLLMLDQLKINCG